MSPFVVLELTVSLLIRTLVAQPFTIPAGSMMPTLEVGDYLVATKYPYGYSNFSLPLGQLWPSFAFAKGLVKRGDVVIFKMPKDPSIDYVKRVIGLPGDTVQVKGGVTYLNGEPLKRMEVAVYAGPESYAVGKPQFEEYLPDGRHYTVLEIDDGGMADNTQMFTVPAGHYFMMGDNRDNSNDSRFDVGFVPEANVFAKAAIVLTWPNGKFTRRDVR